LPFVDLQICEASAHKLYKKPQTRVPSAMHYSWASPSIKWQKPQGCLTLGLLFLKKKTEAGKKHSSVLYNLFPVQMTSNTCTLLCVPVYICHAPGEIHFFLF